MEKNNAGRSGGRARKDEVLLGEGTALAGALAVWLESKKARDYVAVQAFLEPSAHNTDTLRAICTTLRDRLEAATTLGFGPRFLHSTGQLHKGGPNSVLVLQVVDKPDDDLFVPETNYSFDALIRAQALGDFTALKQRRRRILRVNLAKDTEGGLQRLLEALRG